MTDSQQLLADYLKNGSEAAFRELLSRYVDLVYSTALRLVNGDAHRAQDVAQMVFTDLARGASRLSPNVMLGGWLHRHTCFAASKLIRTERRRQIREQHAMEINAANSPDDSFEHLAPALDEAINELSENDRTAILLRFYEHRDLRSIGETLGSSEDAAQKRVSRALNQLHLLLTRRGIAFSAAGLATILAAKAVTAAPTELAAALTAGVLSGTSAATTTIVTTTKIIAMTTLQKAAITVAFAIVAGAGIQQAYKATQLRGQIGTLQQQQKALTAQIQQLQQERDDATNRLTSLAQEKHPGTELLKLRADATALRAEVGALRQSAREQAANESVVGGWANRIALLKQKLDQMPDKLIPELAFLSDKDWAAVTRDANLDTDDGVRQALQALRSAAKDNFLNATREAIRKYAASANGGGLPQDSAQFAQAINARANLLPTDMAQLKPYYDVPVDDALLQRYQFLHPTTVHDNLSDILVNETAAPVDPEYDTHHEIGLQSGGTGPVNVIQDAVNHAAKDYAQANAGQTPSDPSQISPYLKSSLDPTLVKKYLDKLATGSATPGK